LDVEGTSFRPRTSRGRSVPTGKEDYIEIDRLHRNIFHLKGQVKVMPYLLL